MPRRQPVKKPAKTVAGLVREVRARPAVGDAVAAYRANPSPDNMLWLALAVKRAGRCTNAMAKKVAAALVG